MFRRDDVDGFFLAIKRESKRIRKAIMYSNLNTLPENNSMERLSRIQINQYRN